MQQGLASLSDRPLFSFHFLEQACEVTTVYEAMLMENFTACSVGFYVCTKGSQRATTRRQGEKMKNGASVTERSVCLSVYQCVCGGLRLYIPTVQRTVCHY